MAQQSYKKFVATAATATLVASALVPVASANVTTSAFTDVPASYKEAVDFVVSNNISNGLTATQYGISQSIKRGDAAIIIASAAGLMDKDAPAAGFSDVPARGALAVNSLKKAGVISGKSTTKFGFEDNITRGEAALMLTKAFDLKAGDTKNSFTDVKDSYDAAVDALVANKVTSGINATQFGTGNPIKRGDFAKFIYALKDLVVPAGVAVEAVTVQDATTLKVELKEENAKLTADDFKVIVDGSEVKATAVLADTKGSTYTLTIPTLDGKNGVVSVNGKQVPYSFGKAAVESVKAETSNTLTLTGEGLRSLKPADITLAGNEAKTVAASADGKTATVTFVSSFVADQEQTVTFKTEAGDKAFTFKFVAGEVKSVELNGGTFDDDTQGQMLTFKVNGQTTAADTEWLRQAGYSVNFVAVDSSNTAAPIFANAATNSSTGLLANEIAKGDYTVEIQIVKNGSVVVSDKKAISVVDLESTTTAITDVELTNGLNFVHNSSTLVTGETATISDIIGNAAGKKDVSLPVSSAKVTSSNPAVISVNNQTLTANVAGTATITVKVGDVSKNITLTVANKARSISKVTPSESAVKLVQGVTRTIDVTTVDQYGDPIAVAAGATVTEDLPKDAAGTNLVTVKDNDTTSSTELVTGSNGKTATGLDIDASSNTTGNGTLIFKDANGKNIGQIAVQVSNVDNVASTKVEYTVNSDKTTNSLKVGNVNEYQVSKLNTAGFYNGAETVNRGPAAANQLTVSSADASVADVALIGSEAFSVTAKKAGTTDIVIKDENGLVKHKFTVTVASSPIVITKVNFKPSKTIDYAGKKVDINDVLDVRQDSAGDSIVYGIEHNANTIEKVRLDDTTATEPKLYIDTNTAGGTVGSYDPTNDILLGVVTAEVLTGATGTAGITVPAAGTYPTGLLDIAVGGTNYSTASTDKGSILFRVLVDANNNGTYATNEAVATTVLNINVK